MQYYLVLVSDLTLADSVSTGWELCELHSILGQRVLIYEGSSKLIYAGVDSDTLILHFAKRDDNDVWRNKISESIWRYLKSVGIENHFMRTLNVREQLIMSVNVYPIFLRLHNISQVGLEQRLGIEPGTVFSSPLMEWHLKSKFLNDPMISRDHIEYFQWLKREEVKSIQKLAIRTNDVLRALFCYIGVRPATVELHFGVKENSVILIGELSPETIMFWDDGEFRSISIEEAYEKMKSIPLQYLKGS